MLALVAGSMLKAVRMFAKDFTCIAYHGLFPFRGFVVRLRYFVAPACSRSRLGANICSFGYSVEPRQQSICSQTTAEGKTHMQLTCW